MLVKNRETTGRYSVSEEYSRETTGRYKGTNTTIGPVESEG